MDVKLLYTTAEEILALAEALEKRIELQNPEWDIFHRDFAFENITKDYRRIFTNEYKGPRTKFSTLAGSVNDKLGNASVAKSGKRVDPLHFFEEDISRQAITRILIVRFHDLDRAILSGVLPNSDADVNRAWEKVLESQLRIMRTELVHKNARAFAIAIITGRLDEDPSKGAFKKLVASGKFGDTAARIDMIVSYCTASRMAWFYYALRNALDLQTTFGLKVTGKSKDSTDINGHAVLKDCITFGTRLQYDMALTVEVAHAYLVNSKIPSCLEAPWPMDYVGVNAAWKAIACDPSSTIAKYDAQHSYFDWFTVDLVQKRKQVKKGVGNATDIRDLDTAREKKLGAGGFDV